MKIKLLALAGFLGAIASSQATIINLSGGPGGIQFLDNTGVPLPNNTPVDIGRLVGGPGTTQPLSFEFFASGGIITTVFGQAGRWAGTSADNTAAADAFNGAQIFARITSPTDGAVTIFTGLGQPQFTFPINAGGVGDTANPVSNNINEINAELSDVGAILVPGVSLQLAAVPEPSIALLGGLALFGGLVRRRR